MGTFHLPVSMDPFVTAFFEIDKDHSNTITPAEIDAYAKKNNLEASMTKKWMGMFDADNTGHITLTQFCNVLGLNQEEIMKKRESMVSSGGLGADIKVLAEDMPIQDQITVSDDTRELRRKYSPEQNAQMSMALKEELERKFGKAWNVVISKGEYWVQCYHKPGRSFHFLMGDFCYSVWQTGAEF